MPFLELGFNTGLLTEFVGGDPIELFVTLDGNDLVTVGVNGVIGSFPQEIETMLLHVPEEFTSFDRHAQPLLEAAR